MARDGTNADHQQIGDIAIDGLTKLAVSAWCNWDTLADFNSMFHKFSSSSNTVHFSSSGAGTSDNNEVLVSIANGAASNMSTSGANLIVTGTWQHWFFYYDGSQPTDATKIVVYFNGAAQTLTLQGASVPTSLP